MSLGNSVGVRLMLAFAGVIMVFGAAVTLSLGRLAAFDNSVNDITGPAFAKVETANEWSVRLLQSARHTRNMLILDDKNKIQTEMDAVAEDKAKRKEYLEALTASASAAEKPALQVVEESRAAPCAQTDRGLSPRNRRTPTLDRRCSSQWL